MSKACCYAFASGVMIGLAVIVIAATVWRWKTEGML